MDLNESKQWLEGNLLSLIDEAVTESVNLDYKESADLQKTDGKKISISKDVSAFANSGGGVLVYGMKEDKDKHVPSDLDIGYNPSEITKEWLEHVIRDNIRPRISGLHINPVQLTTKRPGRVAYVVTVPQGNTAHQADDYRYYKRLNFESVPMYDHEIRDVMNRLRFPLVKPEFTCEKDSEKSQGTRQVFKLSIALKNMGTMSAREMKLILYWPRGMQIDMFGGSYRSREPVSGEITIWGSTTENWEFTTPQLQYTLFPEDTYYFTREDSRFELFFPFDINAQEFLNENNPDLVWKIFADDMPPQRGRISIGNLLDSSARPIRQYTVG